MARVTSDAGQPLAIAVNYACHPTTLAWENTLISPDYIGALREVVETATACPCLFIQGASGDIGPREGFVGVEEEGGEFFRGEAGVDEDARAFGDEQRGVARATRTEDAETHGHECE